MPFDRSRAQAPSTAGRRRMLCGATALALLTVLTPPAIAGGGHAHVVKAAFGGVAVESGGLVYELVARSDSLTLHIVSDHGKPVATAGGKAMATIFAASEKREVILAAAGENRFAAQGSFKTGVGVRVGVEVTLPGSEARRLTFRLK